MQDSRAAAWWRRGLAIVGLVLLAGCSMLRLGYDQGPQLAWWWVDGYADFRSEQAPRVKDAIRQWFAWHRTSQLPGYAAWLAGVRGKVGESVTAAEVCRWSDEVRSRLEPSVDRVLVLGAPLVASLTVAQIEHIETRQAKANDEFRRDFLQPRAEERAEAALKRAVERAKTFYGRLDEAQRQLLAAGLKVSPFDPVAALAERQRRQRDIAETLRRLVAEKADGERTLAALRALAERFERPPDATYRAYQRRLADHNCALTARLHASTDATQRQALRDRLEGWEKDLRLLATALVD